MKILLVCNAGMSTSMMAMNLEEEIKKNGDSAVIEAVPVSEIDMHLEHVDVILLGPQIRFAFDEIKEKYPDVLVMVISPQDFGSMNAVNVLKDIKKELQNMR